MRSIIAVAALAAPIALAQPALAKAGDPIPLGNGVTFDPIVEGRLRYEHVDQPTLDADAVTMRIRAGGELKMGSLSLLAEGEGTLALVDDYNAFPFAIANGQRRTGYSVVPDPMNIDLNRIQAQYRFKTATFTIGRQRINLDDQRWVGSVAWRQNEQTFDAVRGEAKVGPVMLDGTYAISQRTIFGIDAGPRQAFDGTFFFAGAAVKAGPVAVKGFAYLLDYDEAIVFANSSQTYGFRAVAGFPLAPKTKLNITASYARQSAYGSAPVKYEADYLAGEAGIDYKGLTVLAGYEKLGSDAGAAGGASRAVQTPLATLHKFNGWADVFLTTPNKGLEDIYAGVAYKFDGLKQLPGLNAAVTYHTYNSDVGGIDYGDEWNASLGFRLGQFAVLAKYAKYNADRFGTDTEKFWLQAEFKY